MIRRCRVDLVESEVEIGRLRCADGGGGAFETIGFIRSCIALASSWRWGL